MSILSEAELPRPDIQKRINVYDSPKYRKLVKEIMENGSTSQRKFWGVLESQGIPVDRGAFANDPQLAKQVENVRHRNRKETDQ